MTNETYITKAIDILRKYGWQQGEFGLNESPHCIYGALTDATLLNGYDSEVWGLDREAIRSVIEDQYGNIGIVEFNDHPDRTFAEVERVMEKAELKRLEEV